MKIFFLLALVSTSAFATEIDNVDHCQSAVNRVVRIQQELSKVTSEIIRETGDSETPVASAASPAHCEDDVPTISLLLSQRDRLLRELKAAQAQRDRECPRSYPE